MSSHQQLDADFLDQVNQIASTDSKIRFYYCVIVNLAALNHPELIPQVWHHMASHVLAESSHDAKFQAARKLREALIKSCGIQGAAKTGTALRLLCSTMPEELKDTAAPRASEDLATAAERGLAFHKRIYGRNPDFDPSTTVAASPDYTFVVRNLLYGYVFSYDGILNDIETGYVIVSTLIGIDCHLQLRNHMKGMMYNGVPREDVIALKDVMLDLAGRLGVKFKSATIVVPTIE